MKTLILKIKQYRKARKTLHSNAILTALHMSQIGMSPMRRGINVRLVGLMSESGYVKRWGGRKTV